VVIVLNAADGIKLRLETRKWWAGKIQNAVSQWSDRLQREKWYSVRAGAGHNVPEVASQFSRSVKEITKSCAHFVDLIASTIPGHYIKRCYFFHNRNLYGRHAGIICREINLTQLLLFIPHYMIIRPFSHK
jgi:hypothetical protein